MEYLWWGLVFLTGACVGSFLNVCIFRIPQGKSVVFPPSHCPSCRQALQSVDLVPVISYIALKGKCRHCGGKISVQYPAVEFIAGILFLLAVLKYGPTLAALRVAILFAVVVAATVIDLRHRIIPDKLNLTGLILGLPFLFESREVLVANSIGFLVGGGVLLLIAVASRGGMGGGDIKLAAVMGLYLGWKYLLVAVLTAFVAGSAAGLIMLVFKIARLKEPIPFGPYLGLGAVVAALAGDKIVSWYMGSFVV